MTKEEIFKSGFVKAFIRKYLEEQIHGYYPDKDRLLYILCENDEAKDKVTKEQINKVKTKISDLGFEELSYGYLLSCKPESLHNYIEQNERYEFWLNRFAEEFEYSINDFDEVTKGFCIYKNLTELSVEAIKDEGDFWEIYPDTQKPEIEELVINIVEETDLLSLIECEIDEFKENEYWEIDCKEYQKYFAVSKPIELLFNLCELLVQLDRLEMFKEFLNIEQLPPQQTETKTEQAIPNFENNFQQYLNHLDLLEKNEPEKYKFIKEIAGEINDIELSEFIENVALSFEKSKKSYSKITSKAGKKIFIKEQIELYTYANHRFEKFGDYANETFDKYQPIFIEALEYWKNEFSNLKILPPQRIAKQKPELTNKLISFKSPEIIEKLHNELKGCFTNKEDELLKALQGETLPELLLFPLNQNKFVEVFKRAKYNGFILSNPKQINNWICSNFSYCFEKGKTKEVRNFSHETIKTILTNHNKERMAEPTPSERICTPDWLPHYWNDKRKEQQNK